MQPSRNKPTALPWFLWLTLRKARDLSARSKERRKCAADSEAANDLLTQIHDNSEALSSFESQQGTVQTVAKGRSAPSFDRSRLPGSLSAPGSQDLPREQEHAPYPQEAQASALLVDTSADGGSTVVIAGGDRSTTGRETSPRTPLSVKATRTWFLLLAMIGAFFLCFWTVQPMIYLEVGGAEPGIEFAQKSLTPAFIGEDDVNDYDGMSRGDASVPADVGNTNLTAVPELNISERLKLGNLSYIGDLLRNRSVY